MITFIWLESRWKTVYSFVSLSMGREVKRDRFEILFGNLLVIKLDVVVVLLENDMFMLF